ncbi:MAG: CoA transferase [Actinomycetota bacterium]|nr:CoA transferase [Actinomycetota bacterium]
MLSGPFATMLLADLGADVVKVESLTGDATRGYGPFAADDDLHAYGGYFQSVNRNKRSIALDLKAAGGRDAALRLSAAADIVIENFRVGAMDRLGLSYETLQAANPRLVYAAIRGFGDPRSGVSPYQSWPAFDVIAQAVGGLMGITGPGPGQPTKVGPGVGDIFPGTLATVGILAALHHARATGEGQFVDVAMYDGVLALCERIVYQQSYLGEPPGPEGNGHPLLCPFGVFPARDGFVTIAAPHDHQWRRLASAMDRPELAADAGFATNAARLERRGEVERLLTGWTATRTRAEITDRLGGEVPCGPVNTADVIMADPHVRARDMLVELDQPGSAAALTVAGSPIKLSRTPAGPFRRAPLLSEHADEVLAEVGVPASTVAGWRGSGALL